MNIEEILPELFGEKRVYYCQRCLNHGLQVKRKNHKSECAYRFCICNDCQMVDKRRELNSRLLQIESESPPPPPAPAPSLPLPLSIPQSTVIASTATTAATTILPDMSLFSPAPEQVTSSPPVMKGKERRPNCQRCAQHSVLARLKGHKRCCPFRDCPCAKCQVVQERQKLMADQIKLRRRQKKQKNLDALCESDSSRNTTGFPEQRTLFSGCLKCAQQALAYQQILTFIDPSATLQPSTFSAILAACPHKNNNYSDAGISRNCYRRSPSFF